MENYGFLLEESKVLLLELSDGINECHVLTLLPPSFSSFILFSVKPGAPHTKQDQNKNQTESVKVNLNGGFRIKTCLLIYGNIF